MENKQLHDTVLNAINDYLYNSDEWLSSNMIEQMTTVIVNRIQFQTFEKLIGDNN